MYRSTIVFLIVNNLKSAETSILWIQWDMSWETSPMSDYNFWETILKCHSTFFEGLLQWENSCFWETPLDCRNSSLRDHFRMSQLFIERFFHAETITFWETTLKMSQHSLTIQNKPLLRDHLSSKTKGMIIQDKFHFKAKVIWKTTIWKKLYWCKYST